MKVTFERGRGLVIAIIAITLTSSLGLMMMLVIAVGPDQLPIEAVRFGMAVLICYFVYQGVPAARWLLVFLDGIGAWIGISSGHYMLAPLGITQGAVAVTLMFSPSVSLYFRKKARGRSESSP